jgi:uncharacterized protein YkwD
MCGLTVSLVLAGCNMLASDGSALQAPSAGAVSKPSVSFGLDLGAVRDSARAATGAALDRAGDQALAALALAVADRSDALTDAVELASGSVVGIAADKVAADAAAAAAEAAARQEAAREAAAQETAAQEAAASEAAQDEAARQEASQRSARQTTPAPAPAPVAAPPTTQAPAPAPQTIAAASPSAAEGQFLALVNQVRAGAGLPALRLDGTAQAAARAQAQRMAASGSLGHQNLGALLGPFRTVGENVGYGPSVAVIHNALVASPGHFANMVNADFTAIGIGVVVDGNGTIWTSHVFGG